MEAHAFFEITLVIARKALVKSLGNIRIGYIRFG